MEQTELQRAIEAILFAAGERIEIQRFADEGLTRSGGRGDTGHEGEGVLLFVEVLKAYAGSQCAEDGERSDDHGGTEGFGDSPAY